MKKIFFSIALLIACLQQAAICQTNNPVVEKATSRLKTLLTDQITEKAYLHFDRPYPYYVAGDIVYFKAYVTKGERHELSDISGMLHVDLINKNDVLMQSIILQLNGGIGWGDIALPDTLQKGIYRIRAYTEWMRNDKNPNYFEHSISVGSINSVDRIAENVKQSARPEFQFFPEGGNLVTGIHSRVAFKAVGPDGLGINVKGVVVDNEHREVAKITSSHLGMGVFDFMPETGKKYNAKITFADGSQATADLPAIEEKGITLAVNTNDPAKVSIEISTNAEYFKENKDKELNILIYSAGGMRSVTTKLDSRVLGLDLPAGNFRTGILQITLLSQTGEPLNERMVFIQNPDQLNLSLSTNKPVYAKRGNVQLNLNAKNKDGNAVNGYFSVSVIDESKILVDENSENTILSYLLLSSDVKGYVEKPNYYFANVTPDTRANLDVVMLTHGYRRFVWKELLNDNNTNTAVLHRPEQSLEITGTLKTRSGTPLSGAKLLLLPVASTEVTDAQGRFRFKISFQSGTKFILKMQSSSGRSSAVLTLDNPIPGPDLSAEDGIDAKYNANADILASLQNNQKQGVITASNGSTSIILKNDKILGPKRTDAYRSSNLGGPGHADQVVHGDEIKNAPTLSAGLNGLLRGVLFNSGVPALNTGYTVSAGYQNLEPMLVVVDGNEIGQGISVDQYSPGSVETVEVLKGPNASIYGVVGGQGVLVITTRVGGEREQAVSKEMSPGIFSIEPKGFYKAREFYSPTYDNNQPVNKVPDLRTTIFWKPDVSTDTGGNASFNYFNADGTGSYRVVVEGIDGKGNLGRQVFRYKVE